MWDMYGVIRYSGSTDYDETHFSEIDDGCSDSSVPEDAGFRNDSDDDAAVEVYSPVAEASGQAEHVTGAEESDQAPPKRPRTDMNQSESERNGDDGELSEFERNGGDTKLYESKPEPCESGMILGIKTVKKSTAGDDESEQSEIDFEMAGSTVTSASQESVVVVVVVIVGTW